MTTNSIYRVEISGRDAAGATTTFHYATAGYCTTPTHPTIPSTWIDGRLTQPLLLRRDLYAEGSLHGSQQIAHGQVVLQNSDGALDALMNYAFDANFMQIKAVDPSNINSERVVFRGYTEQVTIDKDQVVILVRDETYLLDKALQPNKYAGTNSGGAGVEGTADDLLGHPKPLCFGWVWNISPILVNTTKLIYQVHDGAFTTTPVSYQISVYDMRAQITTRGADYTSQADMEGNAPAPFSFRVWPAGGMFRLGSKSAGRITVDMYNPVNVVFVTSANRMQWDEVLRTVLNRAYGAAFARYDYQVDTTVATNNVGVYWTDEITIYEAAVEVAGAANISFQMYPNDAPTSDKWITLDRIEVPGVPAPSLALDGTNIIAGSLKKIIPRDPERGIPPWRVSAFGQRNRTIMSAGDISGSAPANDVAYLGLEWRSTKVDTTAVLTQYPNAPEIIFIGCNRIPSTITATYLSGLLAGPKRSLFSVQVPLEVVNTLSATRTAAISTVSTVSAQLLGPLLGTEYTLKYPRFNLNGGVQLCLMGYSLDYAAQVAELLLWGITP